MKFCSVECSSYDVAGALRVATGVDKLQKNILLVSDLSSDCVLAVERR